MHAVYAQMMQVPEVLMDGERVGWGDWHRDIMVWPIGGGPRGIRRLEAVWRVWEIETVWQMGGIGRVRREFQRNIEMVFLFVDDNCYPENPEGDLSECEWIETDASEEIQW